MDTSHLWLIISNVILTAFSLFWFLRWLEAKRNLATQRRILQHTTKERDLHKQLNDIYAQDITDKVLELHKVKSLWQEVHIKLRITLENEDFLNWQVEHLADLNDRLNDRIQQAEEDFRHAKFHLATITKE